ncbi:MAG: hypothetical protein M3Y86_12830 [Verrucomicrobiota bacterium]|nr:hypothetical protein [Verrucomicrobiota bacterium]
MSGFFEEVQRRKVYRVAVAYVVAGGGIIQLASAAFPAWELPNWALRLVIVLLLIGFPIALIFAWVFDVTPEGIQRTSKAQPSASPHRRRNIAILCVAGILISAAAGFFLLPHASADKIDKSIAVLPFENLSDDKENAYFADGIQDDILTNLSKIGDLKVVSRTSVMGYRGKPSSLREIGKALGVSTILEGTVRKSGSRVRVNVQLINAANDEHIWAQEYDRELTDVFAIQTDLSQKIANELQAKLSPTEKAQLERKPTENGEAYLAFVQAHDLNAHLEEVDTLRKAEQLYERAVQLDPKFALAYAAYSQLESWILHTFDPSPARREKARTLATRALELQADLPEAHLALGFIAYYGDGDYAAARREFEIAQRGLPNDADVFLALAAILRRQGHWAESNANFEKAAALNPKQTWALHNLAFNYEMAHDYDNANAVLNRALAVQPDSIPLAVLQAKFAVEDKGDFSLAEKVAARIAQLPGDAEKAYYICNEAATLRLFQRDYAGMLRMVEGVKDETLHAQIPALATKYVVIGIAQRGVQNEPGARAAFETARGIMQPAAAAAPDDPDVHAALGTILAYLGEKEAALAEVQHAVALLPLSKDAFHGPEILQSAVDAWLIVGENERALQGLEELSKHPCALTDVILKLSPFCDPIRNDPRFLQLLPKFREKI